MTDPMDASTFTLIQSFTVSSGSYGDIPLRVDFDTYTGHGVYIAFRCIPTSNANVYIDDVTLQRIPSCIPVENLTVTDTTENSAHVAWTISEDITSFIVEHKATTATTWQSQTVNGFSADLTGLTPSTTYDVRVRPNCTSSLLPQMATFTTLASTATSATNGYIITGLTGLTLYEIQVQANCGDGNLSDWSGSITATTTNVGIETFLASRINIFPNPANDVVNVQCTMYNVQCLSVEVYDVYGKLINTVGLPHCDSRTTSISVSGLADGMCFVRVITDKGSVTKNFVKK